MAQLASIRQMSMQVSRSSPGEYHADEQAGVTGLSWRVSGRSAGSCRAAPLASIRQMSGQGSQGSICAFQADQRAGVAGLRWRVSGRSAGRCRGMKQKLVCKKNYVNLIETFNTAFY